MTELRNQLQDLQREYRAARYPGNLAAELLDAPPVMRLSEQVAPTGRRRSGWRLFAFASAASGLAAAIVVWVAITRTNPAGSVTGGEVAVHDSIDVLSDLASLPPLPEVPGDVSLTVSDDSTPALSQSDLSLVPSGESLELPGVPMVPTWDLIISNPSDSKEST